MAAYKTEAFVRSKYYTPFQKTPLKWVPLSKSGASKSRTRWAAHTRIGNVWEYPPRVLLVPKKKIRAKKKVLPKKTVVPEKIVVPKKKRRAKKTVVPKKKRCAREN